jgi:Fe-S cluster assembly ATP-binding protein
MTAADAAATEEDFMLELKNISYEVEEQDSNIAILRDINLTIEDKFVAVTGPNGGGKSTLAKVIAGILTPTSGQILFDGEDITGLDITERAKKGISFAFQQPVRFKGLTVRDLLTMAYGRKTSVSEICEVLSEVGLCARDYVNREVNASLSGGELKRIEIAMIIARGTKLSVFDEPEAGIDLWSFNNLIRVFEKLRSDVQGSILIISHQERILKIADKIVLVADGRLEAEGSKDEILPKLLNAPSACKVLTDKL